MISFIVVLSYGSSCGYKWATVRLQYSQCVYFSPVRYSWCSKRLIEERYTWSNQLTLSDLIPLETPINSARPPGGQWKERLIVGHNVSFDRSFIKEQYLLKVSVQRAVCFVIVSYLAFYHLNFVALCLFLLLFVCMIIKWFYDPCCTSNTFVLCVT